MTTTEAHTIPNLAKFVFAGNATFTVENVATGNRFTFKVRQPDPKSPHFVSVLTGSNNEEDYTFLGTAFSPTVYRHGARSRIAATAPSAVAFAWLFGRLASGRPLPESVRVHHEGRCGRCGRALTVPESIESGFGPECAKR